MSFKIIKRKKQLNFESLFNLIKKKSLIITYKLNQK